MTAASHPLIRLVRLWCNLRRLFLMLLPRGSPCLPQTVFRQRGSHCRLSLPECFLWRLKTRSYPPRKVRLCCCLALAFPVFHSFLLSSPAHQRIGSHVSGIPSRKSYTDRYKSPEYACRRSIASAQIVYPLDRNSSWATSSEKPKP